MCLTSPARQDFKLRPTKLMCATNFGLYSYCKNLLTDNLTKTRYIVVMFDQPLNEVLH